MYRSFSCALLNKRVGVSENNHAWAHQREVIGEVADNGLHVLHEATLETQEPPQRLVKYPCSLWLVGEGLASDVNDEADKLKLLSGLHKLMIGQAALVEGFADAPKASFIF